MRKKSHIALTTYLIHKLGIIESNKHKFSFYIGSLLPDCVPSFLTKRHCIEDTFYMLKKEIENITVYNDVNKGVNTYYLLKLGVVTHFIADYFTYPHNNIYEGNLSAHCVYEKELKYALNKYINGIELSQGIDNYNAKHFELSVDEICNYIKQKHTEYLNLNIDHNIDCEYIVDVCQSVALSILHILEHRMEEMREKEAKVA